MKNLLLFGILIITLSCNSKKMLINENYRTNETLIIVKSKSISKTILKSEQFTKNDTTIISFRNLPFEFNIQLNKTNEIIPKFYYWKDYIEIVRREYQIDFEKFKLTINKSDPNKSEYLYGKINAITKLAVINGKKVQYKIKGYFKHKLLESK